MLQECKVYSVLVTGKTLFSGEQTKVFKIKRQEYTVITAPTANNLTYNGTPQPLITPGESNGGTMMYSTTENGEYSTTIPTGTDAGYYDVWYKIVSNDNDYDDTDPVNLKVEIKYLEINGCEAKEGLTYTGEEQELITLHDGVQIQFSYYYYNNSEDMCNFEGDVIPTAINAGEYNLTCCIDSNNPNIIISEYFLSLTFTISPASFTNENAPTANTGLTYTGSEQALVTPKPVVGGKVWYSTDGGTTWSDTVPTATNAGDYDVWYKIVAETATIQAQTRFCLEQLQLVRQLLR